MRGPAAPEAAPQVQVHEQRKARRPLARHTRPREEGTGLPHCLPGVRVAARRVSTRKGGRLVAGLGRRLFPRTLFSLHQQQQAIKMLYSPDPSRPSQGLEVALTRAAASWAGCGWLTPAHLALVAVNLLGAGKTAKQQTQ